MGAGGEPRSGAPGWMGEQLPSYRRGVGANSRWRRCSWGGHSPVGGNKGCCCLQRGQDQEALAVGRAPQGLLEGSLWN